MKQTRLRSPLETRYCTLICKPPAAVKLQQEILCAIYGWKVQLISRPVVNTIASEEIDLPPIFLEQSGAQTNRNLSINTSGMEDDVGMCLAASFPCTGPLGFRRNLVCFAKSGQVDRLPLPRLIPAVIFGRCHCSESPGSEPGFRCERQAGCQVLLATFTQLEAPALTWTGPQGCSPFRHYTTPRATSACERRLRSSADSLGRLYGICRCCWVFFCRF